MSRRLCLLVLSLSSACASTEVPAKAPPATPPGGPDVPAAALLRGTYAYMADAGLFKDCRTGKTLPVAQTADNASLQRAYLDAQSAPGAPLLVTFEGHVEAAPAEEGDGREHVVVVDRFDRVWPGATCEQPAEAPTSAAIEGTRWKLSDLRGQPALGADNERGPHLELDPAQQQARGSGGCNSFFGTYTLAGESLRFGDLAATRRACLDSAMNDQETAFLAALGETRRWQLTAGTLVLSGEGGPLLRFVTVAPK